jgi:hypothetical protein
LPSSFVVAAYTQYASLLRISGGLHLGILEQPAKNDFFDSLVESKYEKEPSI